MALMAVLFSVAGGAGGVFFLKCLFIADMISVVHIGVGRGSPCVIPLLAPLSAISLPVIPVWLGIHMKVVFVFPCWSLFNRILISFTSCLQFRECGFAIAFRDE